MQEALWAFLRTNLERERVRFKEVVSSRLNTKIGEYTVGDAWRGGRGIKFLICETSHVDAERGLLVRGISIADLMHLSPEQLVLFSLTGAMPSDEVVAEFLEAIEERSELPDHVTAVINALIAVETHPMATMVAAITALDRGSFFRTEKNAGSPVDGRWEVVFLDMIRVLGVLPEIAGRIYRGTEYTKPEASGSLSERFAKHLGFDGDDFVEMNRRAFLTHFDHESANASAHAANIVRSTLASLPLTLAAGGAALSGDRHGAANQETLQFVLGVHKELGNSPNDETVLAYLENYVLVEKKKKPGSGHAKLVKMDLRYLIMNGFGLEHPIVSQHPIFRLGSQIYRLSPQVMEKTNARDKHPNVDAATGPLYYAMGLTYTAFYTNLFFAARILGMSAQAVWATAVGLGLEREDSITVEQIEELPISKVA